MTPPTPPAVQPIKNNVAFQGTGPDAVNPAGVSSNSAASVPIQIVTNPNTGPGTGYAQIYKQAIAPIPQAGITSGNQYVATYPGDWVPNSNIPSFTVGTAAASFQTTITYGLVGRYQTTVYDPVPCLTNLSGGNKYSSNAHTGPVCQHVAFHTQSFYVKSPGYDTSVNGLGRAYSSGWRPSAILTNGSTISLNATSPIAPTDGAAYFVVPAGVTIATIVLPPDPALMTASIQLEMWGYCDASLESVHGSVNEVHNVATAVPQISGTPLSPVMWGASVYTVPPLPQLGISKSFGGLGAGPGGTTVLTMAGSVNLPDSPLTHDVVLTDLLPHGLTWANPTSSTTVTLQLGRMAPSNVRASIQRIVNYQGSGRELIRIRIGSSHFTSTGYWGITLPTNLLEMVTPTALGVYLNTDQIFLFGLGLNPLNPVCSTPGQNFGGISTATYQSDNSLDLAGDGNLIQPYCQNSASLVVQGTGAAFALTKTVQGNLDSVPRGPLGIGNASIGGSGVYNLTWTNVGSDQLVNAVIYDILPFIGDTGVSAGQSGVQRGSQFAPTFDSVTAPAGVITEYSESTNPCRPQVYLTNPSCVNDWTTTPPTPLSLVKSLRFTSPATYSSTQGFAVQVKVSVPSGVVNQVAWNSAATNATDATDPAARPLPAEPPKVGLVAPSTPTLSSVTSDPVTTAFSPLSDHVTIAGTGGAPGTLTWTLYGPIAPNGTSCEGLSWTGAPVTATGSVPVSGDGVVVTGPATLGKGGCYSWGDHLVGTSYPYEASLPPGSANEQTVATPFPPTITTDAATSIASDGTQSVTDHVVIAGIPLAAPNPSPLTWSLLGPVAPASPSSCTGVSWTGAPVAGSGTIVITGNGSYDTTPVVIAAPGCYSFTHTLPATADSIEVVQPPGITAETEQILAPTITTTTSSATLKPHQTATDRVIITGTNGGNGTLEWSLVGPVAQGSGSCSAASFAGAPTVASGSLDVSGDGTFTAGPATVGGPGCYSWAETLRASGPNGFPGPVISSPGAPHEVIEVTPWVPTIETTASTSTVTTSGEEVSDSVTISGSGLGLGAGGPSSASLQWTLEGPVSSSGSTCSSVNWSGAPIAASGSITVTQDGTYTTPPTRITATGCYSFIQVLAGDGSRTTATSVVGLPSETVGFATPPPSGGGGDGGLAFTGATLWPLILGGFSATAIGLTILLSPRRGRHRRRS